MLCLLTNSLIERVEVGCGHIAAPTVGANSQRLTGRGTLRLILANARNVWSRSVILRLLRNDKRRSHSRNSQSHKRRALLQSKESPKMRDPLHSNHSNEVLSYRGACRPSCLGLPPHTPPSRLGLDQSVHASLVRMCCVCHFHCRHCR